MSSSKSDTAKFLLDENVRAELYRFLRRKGVDVVRGPKGTVNGELAKYSRDEERVLVTNDKDFSEHTIGTVFGVVWLRIPQDDLDGLLRSFMPLLDSPPDRFRDTLVVLSPDKCETFPLRSKFS